MAEDNRFLCFDLGSEEFAIPLLSVREVIGIPDLTPIPQMPPDFLGVMNLRGSVISVMDLRHKMGLKPSMSDETSVIILDLGEFYIGVVVDKVNAVAQIAKDQISEKPPMDHNKTSQSILGIWQKNQRLVLLLDVAKVLSVDDRILAGKQAA